MGRKGTFQQQKEHNLKMRNKGTDNNRNIPSVKEKGLSRNLIIITSALIVAAVVFVVFLPTLKNGFLLWDDDKLVTENIHIRSFDLTMVKWAFTNLGLTTWHPITFISFAMDHAIWGLDPKGFHLTNNILHSLNALLVFLIVVRLVEYALPDVKGGAVNEMAVVSGVVTALLFGVNPLRVESVAWVTERKDVLYAFFYLLSMLMYIQYASSAANRGRFYLLSLVCFALSLMSKPMAVTLPAVLLLLDYYPLKRIDSGMRMDRIKAVVADKVPFFLLSAAMSFVTLSMDRPAAAAVKMAKHSLMERIYMPLHDYIYFLYKIFLPVVIAPYPIINSSPENALLLLIGAFVLFFTITILCLYLSGRSRVYLTAWLFYMVTLLPVASIFRFNGGFLRFAYLPSLGPIFLAGLFTGSLYMRASKKALKALVLIAAFSITLLYSSKTVSQIAIWKDTISLWSYQLELFPGRVPEVYNNRGVAYRMEGKLQEALSDYNKAIEISEDRERSYNNRGIVYEMMGRHEEAIADYNAAIMSYPEYVTAYINRGDCYAKLGRMQEALRDLTKAIELDPGDLNGYQKRAGVNAAMGNTEMALKDYASYLSIYPLEPDIYFSRGSLYMHEGRFDDAVNDFSRAIELRPGFLEAYGNRGTSYLNLNEYSQAIADFSMVIKLSPKSDMAYLSRGLAYMDMGDIGQAEKDLLTASRLGNKEADKYLKDIGRKL